MLARLATRLSILVVTFGIACLPVLAQDATAPTPTPPPIDLPPWMTADVVKSAVAINMRDAQLHQFNDAVGDYVASHFAMVQKEVKKEAPDLEQRVRSRDNALIHQLDTRMHAILTTDQWPAYEGYKKSLRDELKSMPLPQGGGGTRAQPGVGGGRG